VIVAGTVGGGILRRRAALDQVVLVLAGAALLALSARVSIPLPCTPVPITAQTLAAVLVGGLLGPACGALSVLTYLAVGAAGAPVFALGGGPGYLFGPTGGYLLGMIPAAYLTGALIEGGWARRSSTLLLAIVIGDAAIFAAGLAWLAMYVPPGEGLLAAGLLPFLPGEAAKILLAALALRRVRE
jgi:biotin transport system substrate-specific component